jgi:hypothetical protein
MGMREVHIKPVSNGFIVEVGYQTLVYTNIEQLTDDLVKYQKDPDGMEKYHREHLVNKTDTPQPVQAETRMNTRLFPPPPRDYPYDGPAGDDRIVSAAEQIERGPLR